LSSNISVHFPPKKILVAIDGSDNARRAEDVAIILSKESKADLVILNVYSVPLYAYSNTSPLGGMPPIDIKDMMETTAKQAKKLVEESEQRARGQGAKATAATLQSSSSVVYEIVSYAQNEKVDLIVIGTRGLGGFKKLLLGSVSGGVATHSHCNVLIVK
jgi:nucleotide-binding universal stress UspA family protein